MPLSSVTRKWIARLLSFADGSRAAGKEAENAFTAVFTLPDGRKLTSEDLRGLSGRMNVRKGKLLDVTGTVRYEVIGKRTVPREAETLHRQAREAGGHGEYQKAIALLEQASELAPDWPYPVYDRAYTHMLMNDCDAARRYYRRTLELSPRGFFMAITALDTLTREQKGDLPMGTYLAYVSLEWMGDTPKRDDAVREMVKVLPQFAPAWKNFASLCDDDAERLAAIEKGLAAHPDAETKGMLEINKALVFNLKGDRAGAVQLLGELALNPKSTFHTEHAAKAALSILLMKSSN